MAYGRCTITSGSLNVRSGPSSSYSTKFTIKKDEVVTINSTSGGYHYITHPTGGTGYISSANASNGIPYLTVLSLYGESGTVRVSSGNLNIRTGPDTSFALSFTLSNGTPLTIMAEVTTGSMTWYLVSTPYGVGWGSAQYINYDQGSGGGPQPSTLGVEGLFYVPNPLTQGTPLTVTDYINSNYVLTNVTARIFNRITNYTYYSCTAYPGTYRYNMNNMDNQLRFSLLPVGNNYAYEVHASDASGKSELMMHFRFDVVASTGSGGNGPVYASVCEYTSTLTSAQMYANAAYIDSYLQNEGFSKQARCAVLANMYRESKLNPGIYENNHMNDPRGGYGIVQFTNTDYSNSGVPNAFFEYAYNNGMISSKTAYSEINALATTNPKGLMDAQLACFIRCCSTGSHWFYREWCDHTDTTSMPWSTFKTSTMDTGTLAIIFHDWYERSGATLEQLEEKRAKAARKYYSEGVFE